MMQALNSHSKFKRDMVLSSRKVEIKIKSDADVFHELWKHSPHEVPNLTPTTVQNCQLHEGEFGTVGSVLIWNYFHGKLHIIPLHISQ